MITEKLKANGAKQRVLLQQVVSFCNSVDSVSEQHSAKARELAKVVVNFFEEHGLSSPPYPPSVMSKLA